MLRRVLLALCAGLFVVAGLNHFLAPDFYLRIMPPWVPWPDLTHRVAGPTRVLEAALRGLRGGDYGRRVALRRRDCLHTLAAEVDTLAKQLDADRRERTATLRVLDSCLREKDVDGAREVLARLLGPPGDAKPADVAAG